MRAAATLATALVDAARGPDLDALPADAVTVAKQCVLDWLGVTLAGAGEDLSKIVRDEVLELGSRPEAAILGTDRRAAAPAAALANGVAGHALDYDDTNLAMMGHATAPVLPAALALAETLDLGGDALLAAFLAGVEVECRLGLALRPGHYAAGWHPTGTLGTFGAAAASARLLGCDEHQSQNALALAATQAAGLKAAFGSMAKPLQAGKAAFNGLLAARLAARGYEASPGLIDGVQGFVDTHAPEARLEAMDGRHPVLESLFKYDAACYLTHSTIENLRGLRAQGVAAPDVDRIEVTVHTAALRVCDIPAPATGLEGKFSLRATAAMGLLGDATGDPAAFSDRRLRDPELVELRDRVTVTGDGSLGEAEATATVRLRDGRSVTAHHDAGVPARDLGAQQRRLEEKFLGLAGPVLGDARAKVLRDAIGRLESIPVRELARLAQTGG